jgi:hypothetical protein
MIDFASVLRVLDQGLRTMRSKWPEGNLLHLVFQLAAFLKTTLTIPRGDTHEIEEKAGRALHDPDCGRGGAGKRSVWRFCSTGR